MSQADGELLARLSRGDRSAFDDVFRTWYARLVRVADGIVHDESVAEELVQDVMLELWRRREQLAADGAVHAYLLRATRNRALNHQRHLKVAQRGAVHVATDEARPPVASSMLEATELDAAVRRAMDDLPPRCREVFELSRLQGLRYSEIAESLGVSVKAVEAQMGRALRTMREHLREWLPEGEVL